MSMVSLKLISSRARRSMELRESLVWWLAGLLRGVRFRGFGRRSGRAIAKKCADCNESLVSPNNVEELR